MISGCKLEKAIFTIRRTGRKKLIFKAMPKRERQRVTTRRPQRKQKKKNNNNNKTGAVYKPVITNVELQSTLSLRSMAVLSSRAQERRSREIRARSARERAAKPRVASAPISSRFLCPRPPLLLSAPNQNRHATQAKVPWSWFSSFSLTGLSRERFGSLSQFKDV